MSVSEIIGKMKRSFFVIYGGTNLGLCIFILTLARRGVLATDIYGILIFSLLSCLSYFVFYSKEDLFGKRMFIRIGLNFVINLALLLSAATYFGWLTWLTWRVAIDVILFVFIFIVIYVAVAYRELYEVKKLADEINEKLHERNIMRNRAKKNGNNH